MFVSVDCKTTGAFNKDRALEFVRRLESRPGHNSKTEEARLNKPGSAQSEVLFYFRGVFQTTDQGGVVHAESSRWHPTTTRIPFNHPVRG